MLALGLLGPNALLALGLFHPHTLLALRTLGANALLAAAALGLLGARFRGLGSLFAALSAALGLGRSRDGNRGNGGDQERPGHELYPGCEKSAPFWRKSPDYNMNVGRDRC